MRLLIQRVTQASVTIDNKEPRRIGKGAVVLLGIRMDDTLETVRRMAEKFTHLRSFEDGDGKTNLSIQDVQGDVLVVSQFTLYADCSGGRRPSFTDAARPETALPLYKAFLEEVNKSGLKIETGEFGAKMLVDLQNDGPFTILLESEKV